MFNVAPASAPALSFNPQETLQLYLRGEHGRVCEIFLRIIDHFRRNTLIMIDAPSQHFLNSFVKTFLYILTQPDFRIPDQFAMPLVGSNRVICNMIAISSIRTSDPYLEILRDQQGNFVKILTLYSARNTVKFDVKVLFDTHPEAASLWYIEYGSIFYSGLVNPLVRENLRQHFLFSHPKMLIPRDIQEAYFGSTYTGFSCDRAIKKQINSALQSLEPRMPPIRNTPKRNKIAVLSTNWTRQHSVYRNYYAYLKALKTKYHLTFFQLGNYQQQEVSLFDEHYQLHTANGQQDLSRLVNNDFQVLYFPDIGMCAESIMLANRRFAPVQICSPGHSVSTFGAQIDYFISGEDVELKANPEQNYSERLVLLPGMGVIHNRPLYEVRSDIKKTSQDFIINCPWFAQKINYGYLQTLRKLLDRSKKKLRFRMSLGGSSTRANDHLPFYRDIAAVLGAENFEILPAMSYPDYMAKMQEGDVMVDSFHFGGCNTVSDCLFIRVPTLTWEGTTWYNRIGSQMLRLVGMQECIATNEEEYLEKALRLIHDDAYRADIRRRLEATDLDSTIYATDDAKYFLPVVDYLVENHERLQKDPDRSAIYARKLPR